MQTIIRNLCFINILAVMVVLMGCSNGLSTSVSTTPNGFTPSVTAGASKSPIPPTILPTDMPKSPMLVACPALETEIQTDEIDGSIVLSGDYGLYLSRLSIHHSPSYIWNIKDGTKTNLLLDTDEYIDDYDVSPDGKWLAYYTNYETSSKGRLVVVEATNRTPKIFSQGSWWGLVGWLNNEQLLIDKFVPKEPFPTIILNPFSTKMGEILPMYPEIDTVHEGILDWGNFVMTKTIYNSDLSMVIYPKVYGPSGLWDVALWDIHGKREITSFSNPSVATMNAPAWSPDNQKFVVDLVIGSTNKLERAPVPEELFSIDRDGKTTRLTYFSDVYENVLIESYNWSPDNRYIAFWVQYSGMKESSSEIPGFDDSSLNMSVYELAVYDTTTREVKNYCIKTILPISKSIWSPKSNQLLVAGFTGDIVSEQKYGTVLLDIDKNYVVEISRNMIPIGWLTNQPQ